MPADAWALSLCVLTQYQRGKNRLRGFVLRQYLLRPYRVGTHLSASGVPHALAIRAGVRDSMPVCAFCLIELRSCSGRSGRRHIEDAGVLVDQMETPHYCSSCLKTPTLSRNTQRSERSTPAAHSAPTPVSGGAGILLPPVTASSNCSASKQAWGSRIV